jgi:electron transfer flavoprotein alpha subunit
MSKGIYVVVEQRSGKVQNVGLELIGEATRLKEDLKDDVVAVLLGDGVEGEVDKLFHYGADKVVLIQCGIPYKKLENASFTPVYNIRTSYKDIDNKTQYLQYIIWKNTANLSFSTKEK